MKHFIGLVDSISGATVNTAVIASAIAVNLGAGWAGIADFRGLAFWATAIFVVAVILFRLAAWGSRRAWPLMPANHLHLSGASVTAIKDDAEIYVNLKNSWWKPLEVVGIDVKIENRESMRSITVYSPCFGVLPADGGMQIHGNFKLPAFSAGGSCFVSVASVVVRESGGHPLRGAVTELCAELRPS